MTTNITDLTGRSLLVLNWRDIQHPEAGGAEQYMHEIARRWVEHGVDVTWLTARAPGAPARQVIDGITLVRVGGTLTVYLRVALRLLRGGRRFAAIIDCQNGIPFFAPAFAGNRVPVVQVMHHVHQDQFSTHFSPPMAAVGRFLEGPVSRRVYGQRAIAAVSVSTRQELRRRLGLTGPVFIVPNGTAPVPEYTGPRDPDPTIGLVTRLVPHKRVDLLLRQLVIVASQVPRLHVDIIGGGSELDRLRRLTVELGLQDVVTLHGRQPDHVRDCVLHRAWLTTSTSAGEGWGCSIIEAAAWGIPCVALQAPGVRDSVVHERTGWLVQRPQDFGQALIETLHQLADEVRAQEFAQRCQAWAGCFSWDRAAELLAGVVLHQIGVERTRRAGRRQRRYARSDITTVARYPNPAPTGTEYRLRTTDEVRVIDQHTHVLLGGCDELDALTVLERLGVPHGDVRLADRTDLLAGPGGAPMHVTSTPGTRTEHA